MAESKRGATPPADEDRVEEVARRQRAGLRLFVAYVVLYVGFMILAAFYPERMAEPTPFGGVNLAIAYGMGLILAALVLALVYMLACRPKRSPPT